MTEADSVIREYVERVVRGDVEGRKEYLGRKLEEIVADPELAMLLGGRVTSVLAPVLVTEGRLTQEQANRIRQTELDTLRLINATYREIGGETIKRHLTLDEKIDELVSLTNANRDEVLSKLQERMEKGGYRSLEDVATLVLMMERLEEHA